MFSLFDGPHCESTSDPGVVSSILARSHILVEIDQEINSMVFLLILLIQEGLTLFKLKKILGSKRISTQFIQIISHYKKIGYNIITLQQTACLVVNPITIVPMCRISDSMTVPT